MQIDVLKSVFWSLWHSV